ncbi:MAG: hypothetical protein AAF433_20040 [Bacteroidota bacterium]
MPTPSQKDLIILIRKGRLEKAMQQLTEAADRYVETYGLIASIKDAYMQLALHAGQLSELESLKLQGAITDDMAAKNLTGIQARFMKNFDEFPDSFWADEAPVKQQPLPPPIPTNRPTATDPGAASEPAAYNQPQAAAASSPPPLNTPNNYQPSSHIPAPIAAILQEYRNKLFLAEMDMAPMDFHRSFEFLTKYMPQVPVDSVYFAFTEKYFWQLSGIVLTQRYLWVKDTFTAQPVYFDYNFIQSITITHVFPQSVIFNGQVNYALGALNSQQRADFRDFLEKMVVALRGV